MFYILYQVLILSGIVIIYTLISLNELEFDGMAPIMLLVGFLFFCYTAYNHIYEDPKKVKEKKGYILYFFLPSTLICVYIIIMAFLKYYF